MDNDILILSIIIIDLLSTTEYEVYDYHTLQSGLVWIEELIDLTMMTMMCIFVPKNLLSKQIVWIINFEDGFW